MKKSLSYFVLLFLLMLTACSSNSESKSNMDLASNESGKSITLSEESSEKTEEENSIKETYERMVIYNADIRMRVKDYQKAQVDMEVKAKKYGGFIVQSNVYKDDKDQMSGSLTVRIPQEHFYDFLHDAEGAAIEVVERNVNGQDVTEEYVDLQSRLRSKRTVEERLLEFMKKAQKTEDLLKISNDLANVQEEIEQIVGRMKYLENQTSLSTISISLFEENVIVPSIEKGDLNTWEKTKKQFMVSTNFLLVAISGIFVFFIGNLPVLITFSILLIVIYFGIKKHLNHAKTIGSNNEQNDDNK